ncbi:MAG: dihydroorotate dehydrogenase-like protein [Treponemataceae bacterium]
MADLSINYLGIELANPIVLAASGLSSTIEGVQKASDAGVGAIVLKSLFEEQLKAESDAVAESAGIGAHPEAENFLAEMGVSGGAGEYLDLIKKAKKVSRAPIIASVNCVSAGLWADFAEQIEASGADALELNIGIPPRDLDDDPREIENRVVSIVKNAADKTSLPLAVKLGSNFTNIANLVSRVADAGAKGVVLFNRFYRFDLDLDALALKAGPTRSDEDDYHEALGTVARLYGTVPCQLTAATGVHSGETALKMIAAGATTVQICSAVYRGGYPAITRMLQEMDLRLGRLNIASSAAFRGRLARRGSSDSVAYERLQYVKALTGIS